MVIPEIVLHKCLIAGLRELRTEPRKLGILFRHLSQEKLTEVKELVFNKQLSIMTNFPKADTKIPVIAITLRGETESMPILGDVLGFSGAHSYVLEHPSDYSDGGASTSSTVLPPPILIGIPVVSNIGSSLVLSEAAVDSIVEAIQARGITKANVHVTRGTGAGQVIQISRLLSPTITLVEQPAVLLSTDSVVDIRMVRDENLPPEEGEPSQEYSMDESVMMYGAGYEVVYDLQIYAANPEQVVYLYAVIKYILMSQRRYLEMNGIQGLKIAGTDLAVFDINSSDAFSRKMTLTFSYVFSFLENLQTFDTIQVNISTPCAVFSGEVQLDE